MQKLAKRLSAVMVAVFTLFSVLTVAPVTSVAASAAVKPIAKIALQPNATYTQGDLLQMKLQAPNYKYRVEYKVVIENLTTKAVTNLFGSANLGYYTKTQPSGLYQFPIHWAFNDAGTYRVFVYVRPANTKIAMSTYTVSSNFTVAAKDDSSAAAETAVSAYEKVVLDTADQVAAADALKTAAVQAVANVTDATKKAAFEARIAAMDKKVADAKVLKVDSVSSVSNTRLNVKLTAVPVVTVDTSSVAVKDANGTAVTVSKVALSADQKTIKVDTAAMTAGAKYTATVGGQDFVFVAMPADSVKPVVQSVVALTNNAVKVTFAAKDADADTALNPANYSIKDSSGNVLAVNSVAAGDDTDQYILKTANQTAGALYTLVVSNVQDNAGNVIDNTASTLFAGVGADTTKPVVKVVSATGNNKVEVTFTEAGTLDPQTALNPANYTFDNGLTATSAVFKKDSDGVDINQLGQDPVVVLTTSAQTGGTLYTMTVQNVKDAAGNVMDKGTALFAGVAKDTTAPQVTLAVATSNTQVQVTFDDVVDPASLASATFTFDNGLTATKAEMDTTDTTNHRVIVTTGAQTSGTLYKLTVAGVNNIDGLAVKAGSGDSVYFAGIAADTTAPVITSVVPVNNTTVQVTFDDKVTEASAENVLNYSFDNGLGYPASASLDTTGHIVTLTTASQSAKVYTLTVNNVVNAAGLTIAANSTKTFGGIATTTAAVKLSSAVAMNASTVRVTFNQAVTTPTLANFIVTSARTGASSDSTDIAYATTAGTSALNDKFTSSTAVIVPVGTDNTTYDIVFATATAKSGSVYTIKVTGVTGLYGKALSTTAADVTANFAGTSVAKADLTVAAVTATYNNQINVIFSDAISGTVVANNFVVYSDSSLATVVATGSSTSLSSDKKTLTVTLNAALQSGKVYYLNIGSSNGVKDASGLFDLKIDTTAGVAEKTFATGTLTNPASVTPEVVTAVMTDVNTLKVKFNTAVTLGTISADSDFKVVAQGASTDLIGTGDINTSTSEVDPSDPTTIIFKLDGTKITGASNGVYTLTLATGTVSSTNGSVALSATDNTANFVASTAKNEVSIASASVVNDNQMLITFSKPLASDINGKIDIVNKTTGNTVTATIADQTSGTTYDEYLATVANGTFVQGSQYEVYVDSSNTITAADGYGVVLKDDSTTSTVHENSVIVAGIAAAVAAPTVAAVHSIDTTVTGTALAGSTVKVSGGTIASPVTATLTGTAYSATITAQAVGTVLTITQTDAAGNVTTATVTVQ